MQVHDSLIPPSFFSLEFCPEFSREDVSQSGILPSFKFNRKPSVRLATLPCPKMSFGIKLDEATDQELTDLGTLSTLRALDISFTGVTDVGLRGLSRLSDLLFVDVANTKISEIA